MMGNTVLITGATSGIGRALAEALHDRGNSVIVTGRRQALLDELCAARPGIVGVQADVTAPLDALAERFADVNVVIANAGISRAEDMTSHTWSSNDARAIVDTNIMGVINTAAAFVPVLQSAQSAVFMATSSSLAFIPRADFPTYCASKAFLHSWLQSLRHQLRGHVEVLELSPPYVQTALTGAHQLSDPRAVPLRDYVEDVMQMLERGDHPHGEVLVERDKPRRFAEREGRYDELYEAMNR